MKKLFMALAATAMVLAACNPQEQKPGPSQDPSSGPSESDDPAVEEALTVELSRRNIDIAGEFDYDITIGDKQVVISLAYADRDEARTLDLEFIGLPSGVEADYVNPYDYSGGKTQEVVFKKSGSTDSSKWDKWTVGVEIGEEIPHFTSLTVAGTDITADGQTLLLPAGSDLTALVVEFTVSPEGAKVLAGGAEINSGDEVDFSDQLNGVVLEVEGGDDSYTIFAKTGGINRVTRVWGHYLKPSTVEDTWYTDVLGMDWSVQVRWDRNIALDDNYVYLASTESNDGAGGVLAKIWAISISDPDNIKQLKMPEGLNGQHKTAGLAVVPDGNGTRLIFCSMAMAAGQNYKIYSYASADADPVLVADIDFSTIGKRIGDRITFFGTWQKGEICSVSHADGTAVIIPVENGVAGSYFTADLKNGGLTTTVGGNGAKLVKYSENEYIWCGTGYPIVFEREGNTFTQTFLTDKELGFGVPTHSFNFFEVTGEKYAVYAYRVNSYTSSEMRIIGIGQDTLAESLELNTMSEHSWKFGLADPDLEANGATAGYQDGNGFADVAIREIGGTLYIAGCGCGSGISLFKVE